MAGGSSRGGGAPPSVTNLKETLANAALTADFRAYLRYPYVTTLEYLFLDCNLLPVRNTNFGHLHIFKNRFRVRDVYFRFLHISNKKTNLLYLNSK
jgi:hypothetical protein